MSRIFAILLLVACVLCLVNGKTAQVAQALPEAAAQAVQLCIGLCGGYAFWMGLIETAREAGALQGVSRMLSPLLRRLFPNTGQEAMGHIATNLSANMLGMGNAATPSGLEAMRNLTVGARGEATRDMIMLVAVNISSIQLLPTGAMTVLAQAGMQQPQRMILPSLAATCVSTAVAVAAVLLLERVWPCSD